MTHTIKEESRKASISILKSRNMVVRVCQRFDSKNQRQKCRKIGLSLIDSKTRLERLTRSV
jgi:hypothetical protein